MQVYSVAEAQINLPKILQAVADGEGVVIEGTHSALLLPVKSIKRTSEPRPLSSIIVGTPEEGEPQPYDALFAPLPDDVLAEFSKPLPDHILDTSEGG
ncbi:MULTISPECIES: type II toxin-antitoxin system Phd/YefM family antitoxin [unclassified Caballeronia]|uniref:type II toxin-antitoxin system Phd/YefM family antitoxin n=1 Tax=unclassified Caballeronia TaxID=2646786 RepID=UPI001FD3F55B|nr:MULTISPECIES: hypothetical protein [unclassified Caballeronia]MDR5801318.1 hypothetical protein [Caballeronia sp. LZ001]